MASDSNDKKHHPHQKGMQFGGDDSSEAPQAPDGGELPETNLDDMGERAPSVELIRKRHQEYKWGHRRSRRVRFWKRIAIVLLLLISAGVIYRAVVVTQLQPEGESWVDALQQGNVLDAVTKFSLTAENEAGTIISTGLSTESIMKQFNDALPHLKKAGYSLTEVEVELGFPPKLIPHFYHNPNVKMKLEKTMAAIGDNRLGKAVLLALVKAGEFQKKLEVGNLQFNHIEIELGPIPALKLQYKSEDEFSLK